MAGQNPVVSFLLCCDNDNNGVPIFYSKATGRICHCNPQPEWQWYMAVFSHRPQALIANQSQSSQHRSMSWQNDQFKTKKNLLKTSRFNKKSSITRTSIIFVINLLFYLNNKFLLFKLFLVNFYLSFLILLINECFIF